MALIWEDGPGVSERFEDRSFKGLMDILSSAKLRASRVHRIAVYKGTLRGIRKDE